MNERQDESSTINQPESKGKARTSKLYSISGLGSSSSTSRSERNNGHLSQLKAKKKEHAPASKTPGTSARRAIYDMSAAGTDLRGAKTTTQLAKFQVLAVPPLAPAVQEPKPPLEFLKPAGIDSGSHNSGIKLKRPMDAVDKVIDGARKKRNKKNAVSPLNTTVEA